MRIALVFVLVVASCAAETGSKACAPCHAAIYRHYLGTPMARSSGPYVATSTGKGTAGPYVLDGATYRTMDGPPRKLDWFIGSSRLGSSFATAVDGWLFQAPVSWYAEASRWDLSPGFATSPHMLRPVEPACLRCHASGVRLIQGTTNRYEQPPFAEGGVSCERCHGPGDAHVARKGAIVNPVKLDVERRDSICSQCHLSGATELSRGGGATTFRAGERLSDKSIVFTLRNVARPMPVISHVERLTQSKCRQADPQRFWCGTCHDPHGLRPVNYRAKCLSCHGSPSRACSGPVQSRRGDCTSCHMPKVATKGVQHAAYTDHSVPRLASPISRAESGTPELVPFGNAEATTREYALAWADLALRENNRQYGTRAWSLLQKQDPEDPRIAAQVAQLSERMGRAAEACSIWLKIANTTAAAAVNAGTCEANAGNIDNAISHWRTALAKSAGLEGARLNLAVALAKSGKYTEAALELEEALRFNPSSRRAAQLLQTLVR